MNDSLTYALLIGISSILGAGISAVMLFMSTRRGQGFSDMQARYDQMQEDLDSSERRRAESDREFRAEIATLRLEMTGLRAEVRVRDDYIGALRQHIDM